MGGGAGEVRRRPLVQRVAAAPRRLLRGERLAVHAGLAELVRVRVEVCRDVVLARPNVVRELAPERAHARGDVLDRPCRKGSRWEHRPEFWCQPEKSPRGPLGGIPLHLGAEW